MVHFMARLLRLSSYLPKLLGCCRRVQAALDTPTHLSKADGKQSQPVLPSLPPVRALLPARPALPTRRKTQDPRPRPKATTVQQEPVMPRVPECNVPAAHGPSVSPEAGMPDGDIAPEVVPARYAPAQHFLIVCAVCYKKPITHWVKLLYMKC